MSDDLIEEVRFWREEARHYAENADFWRANYEALQADNVKLREEIDRLRGPVTYYKKGYGPGDGYAAIQETVDDAPNLS